MNEMATHTLATSGNLTAVAFSPSPQVLLPADIATISNGIRNDPNLQNSMNQGRSPYAPAGEFAYNGLLFIPNRGYLRVLPGDVVAIDNLSGTNVGWPILVSADAIQNGSWTFV
jgi:hypothetical protein